jgi:hypothetical protein
MTYASVPAYYGAFAPDWALSCMEPNVTALERAFALARSGRCRSVKEIRARLQAEGYSQNVVVGRYLLAQLGWLMLDANAKFYGIGVQSTSRWVGTTTRSLPTLPKPKRNVADQTIPLRQTMPLRRVTQRSGTNE